MSNASVGSKGRGIPFAAATAAVGDTYCGEQRTALIRARAEYALYGMSDEDKGNKAIVKGRATARLMTYLGDPHGLVRI